MNYFKFLLLLVFFNMPLAFAETQSHGDIAHDHKINVSELSAGNIDPEGGLINVNVFGLVCDFCAQAIEKVFMKRDEVSGIKVDLSGGLISIFTKKDKTMDDTTVTQLIVDAGYNVDSISRR